jgi:hypothetical protein
MRSGRKTKIRHRRKSGEMLSKCWQWYLTQLKHKSVRTKVWTTCLLFGASDTIAQQIQHTANRSSSSHDFNRSGRAMVFGLGYAPLLHHWFILMEKFVKFSPQFPNAQAMVRVLVHTGIFAPTIAISSFIGFMTFSDPINLFNRKGEIDVDHAFHAAVSRVSEKGFQLWVDGGVFWIPIMFVNYRFFALEHRVMAMNVANLVWTTYLSFRAVGKLHKEDTLVVMKEN